MADRQLLASACETCRAAQEYPDTLDNADWGATSEVRPKFVPRSDPAAQWKGALNGHALVAFATNYLIDMNRAVIMDVEAIRLGPVSVWG